MKTKLVFNIVLILFSNLILNCKKDKNEEISKTIKNIKKERKSFKTNYFDSVNNCSIYIYESNDGFVNIKENDYVINIEKENPYIKYITNNNANLSRTAMKDSVFINKNERIHINNFFLINNSKLKKIYWDSVYSGRVRKIYFLNYDKSIVKEVDIIGEPHNIDYLKKSCDFFLDKVKGQ